MLRKNPKDLFYLIKSLTPTEKKYIRQFASRHTIGNANKTILLFNAVNEEINYDEKVLLKKIDFATKHTLPELKKHLYSIILRGLRAYYDNNSVKQELKGNLHEIEILFNKGLYSQCETLLSNVEKKCYELEYYTELFDVLYWKLRMTTVASYRGMNEEELIRLEKRIKKMLEQFNTTFIYDIISIRFFHKATALTGMKGVRSNEQLEELNNLIQNCSLLQDENKADTILAKYFYHTTLGTYFAILNNEKTYYHFNALIQLLDEHDAWKKANINAYYNVVRNLTLSCLTLNKYTEVNLLIKKLKGISFPILQHHNQSVVDTYNLQLELNIYTGNFESAAQLIPEIVHFFNDSNPNIKLIDTYKIYFNISISLLSLGKHKEALHWLNIIVNTKDVISVLDIICSTYIMQIIIHYELKNYDLLPYLIRNTHRYLRTKKQLFLFEKTVLKYLKIFSSVIHQNELITLYKKLREELILISKDPFEKNAFKYFDFISWLESKIFNKSFLEIAKGKQVKKGITKK